LNVKLGGLLLVAACFLLVLVPTQTVLGQTSSGTVVVPESSVTSGDLLVVNVTIRDVQNLYGIDIIINWTSSTMHLEKVSDWLGVETYPGGVLHETPNSPIILAENDTSQETGQHHIVATSQGDAAPFYGSGTIATLTFTVSSTEATVGVTSELADHPELGETNSEPIPHTDLSLKVNTMPITSPTNSLTPTPTYTPQLTPTPTPEFPQTAIVVLLLVTASAVMLGFMLIRKRAPKTRGAVSSV
jgi:hypothetical protein